MSVTLEQLRAEHEREGIGPELARLLTRVAAATARTYPPDYSDAGVWNDESVQDATQEWVAQRLIGPTRKDLSRLLLGAASVNSLRAGLTRSFGQFLTNRRRQTSATNLYRRVVKMLRADDDTFARVGSARKAHEQLWTLAQTPSEGRSALGLPQLQRLAAELGDDELEVIRYGAQSLKSSPILREPDLRSFLVHLLGRAAGALTPADIIDVMTWRFGLVEPEPVELDEGIEARATPVAARAEATVVAKAIATRVGHEREVVLKAVAEHGDFDKAAEALGVEENVVRRAVSETISMVAEYANEVDEAERIYDLVLETLFGGSR